LKKGKKGGPLFGRKQRIVPYTQQTRWVRNFESQIDNKNTRTRLQLTIVCSHNSQSTIPTTDHFQLFDHKVKQTKQSLMTKPTVFLSIILGAGLVTTFASSFVPLPLPSHPLITKEYAPDQLTIRPATPPSHDQQSVFTKFVERFLPQPQETRDRRKHRRQVEQQTKQALRSAPLPFRIIGNTITSTVGRTMRKLGRQLDPLLQQAQNHLAADSRVVVALGEPLSVKNEIASSSVTRIVNGKKTDQTQATFLVQRSRQNAIGALIAEKKKVVAVEVNIGGRTIVIDT
jgi:hypothetical protein